MSCFVGRVSYGATTHSIEEQHHKSPHQHRDHHPRSGEREGFRCFVVTFNYNLHGELPGTSTKVGDGRDLGYGGGEGELEATAPRIKRRRTSVVPNLVTSTV